MAENGTGTINEDNFQDKKNLILRLFDELWVQVLVALIVVLALSFVPAFIANQNGSFYTSNYPAGVDGVTLLGYVPSFAWSSPTAITVSLNVCGEGKYQASGTKEPGGCYPVNTAVDIYINNLTSPVFSYDPIILPELDMVPVIDLDSLFNFDMTFPIVLSDPYKAPFDAYQFKAFAFAIDHATNQSIPVTYFELSNGGAGDFSTVGFGVATTNTFQYNAGSGLINETVASYSTNSGIKRSRSARALTCTMFAINWALTLCSVITTAFLFHGRGKGIKDGVALFPITVILAIPAIRGLYVGSPPFGIHLDMVGFFPQMITVSICTVVVLFGAAGRHLWEKEDSEHAAEPKKRTSTGAGQGGDGIQIVSQNA